MAFAHACETGACTCCVDMDHFLHNFEQLLQNNPRGIVAAKSLFHLITVFGEKVLAHPDMSDEIKCGLMARLIKAHTRVDAFLHVMGITKLKFTDEDAAAINAMETEIAVRMIVNKESPTTESKTKEAE